MSKRLKNYPDPVLILEQSGADALRLYLINSPVVRGEELRFVEKGVKDVVREVFLPWFNAFRFFSQGVHQMERVCWPLNWKSEDCLLSPFSSSSLVPSLSQTSEWRWAPLM